MEYARNVMGIAAAQHAEYGAPGEQVVTPLACALVHADDRIRFEEGSRIHAAYDAGEAVERMNCGYGLSPEFQHAIHDAGLRVTATDATGEARAVELGEHPFYVATLYQPQLTSTPQAPHPLVTEFLRAVRRSARTGS